MKFIRKILFKIILVFTIASSLTLPIYSSFVMAIENIPPVKSSVVGEFDNECVMGLAEGKRIKTDCSVNTVFEGKTYCFRAEDAKLEFNKDPKRNLERAKDHYAAGEVTQTADDMGKFTVDDVKAWVDAHIQEESSQNNGIFFVHDAMSGESSR